MQQHPVTQQELDRLHAAWESAPESRSFAPLADAYHRAGRNEEAIELLHSGTARHPDYLSALVLLADCYQALGRVEEADAVFTRVLAEDADNVRALEYQAQQSIQQGALGKAASLVEKLRQIDPWDATIRRLSAQLQQQAPAAAPSGPAPPAPAAPPAPTGPTPPPAAAPEADAAASEAAPSADELSTLTLAQIYESQGYLQKALTIYERLLQQHPGNPEVGRRLDDLRRRLSGVDESAHDAAPEAPTDPGTPRGSARTADEPDARRTPSGGWRLVDEKSLDDLQPPAAASAPAEAAPGTSASQGEAAAARDEDFQRFLRYVRSLGR